MFEAPGTQLHPQVWVRAGISILFQAPQVMQCPFGVENTAIDDLCSPQGHSLMAGEGNMVILGVFYIFSMDLAISLFLSRGTHQVPFSD